MKNKKRVLSSLVLFVTGLILVGCSGKEGSVAEEAPKDVHATFLLFKQESASDESNIGALYKKNGATEPEKIADNVQEYGFWYNNETESIFYLDDTNTLYLHNNTEEPKKIAEDVSSIDIKGSKGNNIIYFDEEGALYVATGEKTEKIVDAYGMYKLVGDEVYYNNDEGDLIVYNIDTREEKRITEGVAYFTLLNGEGDIAYTSDEGALFYMDSLEGDNLKIASEHVPPHYIVKKGTNMYFLQQDSNDNVSLYVKDLSDQTREEVVAKDVIDYRFGGSDLYYISTDNSLYKLTAKEETAKRIATDTVNFELIDSGLVILDEEGTLSTWNEKQNEQLVVGRDSHAFYVLSDESIAYLDDSDELFIDNKKLTSDLEDYSFYYGNIAYASEGALHLISGAEKEETIEQNLEDYSAVYFQNQLIYENLLDFNDIAGVWEYSENDKSAFMEITADGQFTLLNTDTTYSLETINSGYDTLTVSDDYTTFEFLLNDSKLSLSQDGEEIPLTVSTKEKAETYIAEAEQNELEMDALSEAEYIVTDFIENLPYAINNGSYYYLSDYIDSKSAFYETQSAFITDLYNQNITEDLYDYQILDAKSTGKDTFEVRTSETFDVYDHEAGEENRVQYEAVYSLKRSEDELLITNLKTQ